VSREDLKSAQAEASTLYGELEAEIEGESWERRQYPLAFADAVMNAHETVHYVAGSMPRLAKEEAYKAAEGAASSLRPVEGESSWQTTARAKGLLAEFLSRCLLLEPGEAFPESVPEAPTWTAHDQVVARENRKRELREAELAEEIRRKLGLD
jgi:hypothetical protein